MLFSVLSVPLWPRCIGVVFCFLNPESDFTMTKPMRTHTCGELRAEHVGLTVTLCGWVARWRDHGGLVFIDLRDRYGMTQAVFNPDVNADAHALAESLRNEYVIQVVGKVEPRPEGTVNPKLSTGGIDILARNLTILNSSDTPPFELEDAAGVSQDLRLKYRFLDLRRPEMQSNLAERSLICKIMRDYFDENGFLEIETPFLTKSTPEGARDYLVPSRMDPGKFYALPQSPQLFKQLLMVAGMDRYFQIVRCFRDEDLRANRQPEFTQLDVEMSFINEDDIMEIIERMIQKVCDKILDRQLELPLPQLTYDEAIRLYGTDAPDLRFAMTICDVTDLAARVEFKVFSGAVASGGVVRGLRVPGGAKFSRKEIDELTEFARQHGAQGLAWFKVQVDGLSSPIAKFFDADMQAELCKLTGADRGDLLVFLADKPTVVNTALAALRVRLGETLKLIDPQAFAFAWVTDFPLVEWDEAEKRWHSLHHPFTSPRDSDVDKLQTDPASVRARAYDLVFNGTELGGGSIRIHTCELQRRIFDLLGISSDEAERRFGFLLEALRYGAPPHGGIALGLDRLVMKFLHLDSLRDTIAFPKTQKAVCPLTGAPGEVDAQQLRELGLRLS